MLPGLYLVLSTVFYEFHSIIVFHNLLTPFPAWVILQKIQRLATKITAHVINHTEEFWMMQSINHTGSTTHRESCNRPVTLSRSDAISLFNIWQKLLKKESLIFPIWCIKPNHIVLIAFWTDNHHFLNFTPAYQTIYNIAELSLVLPHGIVLSSTVHQIENRISTRTFLRIGLR